MKNASHKVPDGKMVKVQIEEDEGKVAGVEIRGDFFIEPPEKLEALEKSIEGLEIDSEAEEIEKAVEEVEAKLIGFSSADVATVFRKAVEGEEQ
jgi:formylmethanofuran dehydrogenase subunit E